MVLSSGGLFHETKQLKAAIGDPLNAAKHQTWLIICRTAARQNTFTNCILPQTELFYRALFCLLLPPGSLNASEAQCDLQRLGSRCHFKWMASAENQTAERIQLFDLISDCMLPTATLVNNLIFVCKLSWKNIQLLLVAVVPYKVRRRRELSNAVSALTWISKCSKNKKMASDQLWLLSLFIGDSCVAVLRKTSYTLFPFATLHCSLLFNPRHHHLPGFHMSAPPGLFGDIKSDEGCIPAGLTCGISKKRTTRIFKKNISFHHNHGDSCRAH